MREEIESYCAEGHLRPAVVTNSPIDTGRDSEPRVPGAPKRARENPSQSGGGEMIQPASEKTQNFYLTKRR